MPNLSVIIPIHNESTSGILPMLLSILSSVKNIEVIIVGQLSLNDTEKTVKSFGYKYVATFENSRARRLNIGIELATSHLLLLHHPRSLLTRDGLQALVDHSDEKIWGGFLHQFDFDHPVLRFTSWYSNEIRARKRGIIYLDHCIFAHRELLGEYPYVPEVDIFEDTLLSRKLLLNSRPVLLPYLATTSAIRFKRNGIYKQAIVNQALKFGYFFRVPYRLMNMFYEANIELNSTYKRTGNSK